MEQKKKNDIILIRNIILDKISIYILQKISIIIIIPFVVGEKPGKCKHS
tara:strand:- start:517 stop:663 length:147 start_codon:yes stop_codon:yes gene_type:complete